MKNFTDYDSSQTRWQRIISIVTTFMVTAVLAFAVSSCSDSGGGGSGVAAPGAPASLTVAATTGVLAPTLNWSMPTTGGAAVSFEVYRSTTAGTAYLLANKITSIPVVAGQTAYSYLDSTNLTPGYWVVSAKNAGGETASAELTVAKPGAPASFSIAATVSGLMSETLTWSPPASGEHVASYEVYRSTTAPAFDPANLVISIPAVSGQATYTFVDDAGLTHALTYWTVSAKNIGGQTAYSPEASATPTGDSVGYGNNFSAGLIFADNIGIGGLGITGTWTNDLTTPIDYNTGLRPTLEQVTALAGFTVPVTTLPYLDPTTIYTKSTIDYYPQQSASTWQGEWAKGAATLQNVNAAWGDNLVSQSFTANSKIRIEMVLSEGSLITPMTSYPMVSLYGAQVNEIQGTTGTPSTTTSAFVFASNAHLKIEKLLPNGTVDGSALYDKPLWSGAGGTGILAGEVNVAGNFTYGFVWDLKNDDALISSKGITTGKVGTWRITFSLDNDNSAAKAAKLALDGTIVPAASNNTNITSATNGVVDGVQQAHIDIVVQ